MAHMPSPSERRTPLAADGPVTLPPLVASEEETQPRVYRVKLNDDFVQQMANANRCAIEIVNSNAAALHMGGSKFDLQIRAVAASTGRTQRKEPTEFAMSRRGNVIRRIAPIAGEADLHQPMSEGVSSMTKKRTLQAQREIGDRSVAMLPEGEEPRLKRTKASTRRPAEKRPRSSAPSATNMRSKPSLRTSPLNGMASTLAQRRIPASAPSNSPSPHMSPGHPSTQPSSTPHASISGGFSTSVSTGRRLSNGSALPPRSTPPPSAIVPTAPRSTASMTPQGSVSRGPSPGRLPSAPSSPRVGNMRSTTSLRSHVIHLLALQRMSVSELRDRIGHGTADAEEVRRIAKTVAACGKDSKFDLHSEFWSELDANFSGYSLPESKFVVAELELRNSARNGGGNTSGGSAASRGSQGSAVSPSTDRLAESGHALPNQRSGLVANGPRSPRQQRPVLPPETESLAMFVKHINSLSSASTRSPIRSSDEHEEYRSQFRNLWTRYCDLHTAIEDLQRVVREVDGKRKSSASPRDMRAYEAETVELVEAAMARWKRYETALQRSHADLTNLRHRIAEYCGTPSN